MEERGNYIIVGAGSTGTSIAYHLASMGQKVTVIDENAVGKIMNGFVKCSSLNLGEEVTITEL